MDQYIRSFIKYIALERRYSEHTIQSYTTDLKQFESFLKKYFDTDKVDWNKTDKNAVRLFMNDLVVSNISRRSVARKLAALKSFYKFMVREEHVSQNPVISLKMPKFEKVLPEYISVQEVQALLKLPEIRTFEGLRDLAILELFYGTGLRLAELINLTMDSILFQENALRIIGKGKKERVIPLGSAAKKIILEYLEFRPQYVQEKVDNLFVLISGKKMYPMAIQRIVGKYLSQVSQARHRSPHLLRHTYATHLLNAGASIRVVKDLLGHESLSTTQVYTHLSLDYLKKIYKKAHPGS